MQMVEVSLRGESSGPVRMAMIEMLGPKETDNRINRAIDLLSKEKENG